MSKCQNPSTPPGSTGCEGLAGRPPIIPRSGVQVCRGPPPAQTHWDQAALKRHLRNAFLTQNKILSAHKARGTFFWLKLQFYPPKRPLRDGLLLFPKRNIWHRDRISNFPLFATKMLKSFCKTITFSGVTTARRQLSF